ncbi:MAG: hypothetical protein IJB69_08175 [Clostridia bacterium]|nr:hypothetical protein [Clostridia bacterium]
MDRYNMEQELKALAGRAFSLPEVQAMRVRDVVISRGMMLETQVKEAVDRSWHDCLSDVDLCVKVHLSPESNVTEDMYMARPDRFGFGRGACLGRSFIAENKMWRLVMKNGMRYDFGFEFEWSDRGVMLSLPAREAEGENPNWPLENADRFFFVQVQALGKLYRRDYLIADHLAHMGLNDTLVQQMVLRDMEKGTKHHRYGDGEERTYEKYLSACPVLSGDESHNRIARKLYAAARAYDENMTVFYPDWEGRTENLLDIWRCYEKAMQMPEAEKNAQWYCEECAGLTEEDKCPECEKPCRAPLKNDPVFLAEKAHPWSDMLADVLKQEGIPCLRKGNLGAGLGMIVGQHMNLESIYVPYAHLEMARDILGGIFGGETEEE